MEEYYEEEYEEDGEGDFSQGTRTIRSKNNRNTSMKRTANGNLRKREDNDGMKTIQRSEKSIIDNT